MVRIIHNFELFYKKQPNKQTPQQTNKQMFKTIFDKALKPFWNTLLWLNKCLLLKTTNSKTTIFPCSKNYSSSTCVTRLKVALNMTDPIFEQVQLYPDMNLQYT